MRSRYNCIQQFGMVAETQNGGDVKKSKFSPKTVEMPDGSIRFEI
ncbi:MAG TPA: hypothetical protein PKX91_01375 [Clostridia bacterium]|nr:hypothetical protein [Clostridia bacterium]